MTALTEIEETDDRFEVRPSGIAGAGDGLFARVALSAGARLRVVGVVVTPDSATDRCTRYADAHKFRVGGRLLLPTGWAGLANHATDPNAARVVDAGTLFMEMLRPIAAGEEICIAYSEYAQARFGPFE